MITPFLFLGLGLAAGRILPAKFMTAVDFITTAALALLMLIIGANIGVNESLMLALPQIGFNCMVITLSAVAFSILFTVALEKTVLPLNRLESAGSDFTLQENNDKRLVFLMPISVVLGVVLGRFLSPQQYILDSALSVCLAALYISVGTSLGANWSVFGYIKQLGIKVVLLPLAILAGSLVGGFAAGLILDLPFYISVVSASGMSYYSVTGAFMSQVYGVEVGAYGFVVNVFREFLTILLLPLIVKISKGSAIAAGGAATMDVVLAPVTRLIGKELALVTLFTGSVLTVIVPLLLPLLAQIL